MKGERIDILDVPENPKINIAISKSKSSRGYKWNEGCPIKIILYIVLISRITLYVLMGLIMKNAILHKDDSP